MTERPILFSSPMVRALLAGAKTQTRRLVKPQPKQAAVTLHHTATRTRDGLLEFTARDRNGRAAMVFPVGDHSLRGEVTCPHGAVGDRLWVREAFALAPACDDPDPECDDDWHVVYRADGDTGPWRSSHDEDSNEVPAPWRPSIHMPRWASRITLEITGVRVERLQAITEEDARAEGAAHRIAPGGDLAGAFNWAGGQIGYRAHFADLWRSLHGPESWDANPWCWCISFRRVEERTGEDDQVADSVSAAVRLLRSVAKPEPQRRRRP